MERQLLNIFTAADLHFTYGYVYGLPPNSPLWIRGIHIHYADEPAAASFAKAVVYSLKQSNLEADYSQFTSDEEANYKANVPHPTMEAAANVRIYIGSH